MQNLKLVGIVAKDENGEILYFSLDGKGVADLLNFMNGTREIDLSETGIITTKTPADLELEREKAEAKDKSLDEVLNKNKKDEVS